MSDKPHNVPDWFMPDDDDPQVLAGEEETERIEYENELGRKLGTGKHVYTEKPSNGQCPYCGKEYDRVSWASRISRKGVCPYPVEEHGDFVVAFLHGCGGFGPRSGSPQARCSIEYEDNLLGTMAMNGKDWDVTNI